MNVKKLNRMQPFVAFQLIVILSFLACCQLVPDSPATSNNTTATLLPTTTTTSTSATFPGTSLSQMTAPTATTEPTATLLPTASSLPTTTAEPTTTTEPTTTAAPTTATLAPTTTTPLSKLPNTKLSWYYMAGDPTGQDRPASIPSSVRKLISSYDVIWQIPPTAEKVIYLTFDEGYEYQGNTARILDTAKLKTVSLTFFITGSYLKNNPALVKRMVNEGHAVANHTANHPDLPDLMGTKGETAVLTELRSLETSYHDLTGKNLSTLVRPPAGNYSERVLACLSRAGYRTAFWSFAYRDWLTDQQPDPTDAQTKILNQLHNGSVLLLHAVSNTNVAILPDLIDQIRSRGYRILQLK